MDEVTCPYCGADQAINHDDGYGFEEDSKHEQECYVCEKTFVYTTAISYNYNVYKADCLNGSEHKYEKTHTDPVCATKWRCTDCDGEKALDKDDPMLKVPIYPGGPLVTGEVVESEKWVNILFSDHHRDGFYAGYDGAKVREFGTELEAKQYIIDNDVTNCVRQEMSKNWQQ